MMMRLIIYLVACIFIMAFIIVTTRKKCFLSKIGMNSVSVYVFHLFAVKWIARSDFLKGETVYFFIFSLVYSAFLSWLFSRDLFRKIYEGLMNLIQSVLYKKEVAVVENVVTNDSEK